MSRLDRLAEIGHLPFDLDFMRAIGYQFGQDWDGEVVIEPPEFLDVERTTNLIRRFQKGIKRRLYFEGRRAREVCVGGPKNGARHSGSPISPVLFHIRRGEWAVYRVKNIRDPRAWFLGIATSKKKARQLWLEKAGQE